MDKIKFMDYSSRNKVLGRNIIIFVLAFLAGITIGVLSGRSYKYFVKSYKIVTQVNTGTPMLNQIMLAQNF